MMSKTIVVFHSADTDGQAAGALTAYYLADPTITQGDILMWPYNYGGVLPEEEDLRDTDTVYVVDLSLTNNQLYALDGSLYEGEACRRLVWIDHHASSIDGLEAYDIEGWRDTRFSAAELVYMFFEGILPDDADPSKFPFMLQCIGDYDIYRSYSSDPDFWQEKVLPVKLWIDTHMPTLHKILSVADEKVWGWSQGWMFNFIFNPDFKYHDSPAVESEIVSVGKELLRYEQVLLEDQFRQAHEVIFEGYPCYLKFGYISRVFEGREDLEALGMTVTIGSEGQFIFSVRNMGTDVDLAKLAKGYGGGGHRNAAGFVLGHVDGLNLIRDMMSHSRLRHTYDYSRSYQD